MPGEVAVDDEEYALGICCLAAPVATIAGVGAVGVIVAPTPSARTRSRNALLTGAGRISRALALR